MERAITGFHQDAEGDWVAELSCGHNQHVRHRPPFQQRPWVLSDDGRQAHVATRLCCPLCDRAELPEVLRFVRTSPEWDETTLPQGLRRAHQLAVGTWGEIVVHEGALRFSMVGDPPLGVELRSDTPTQPIPPQVDHDVEPLGQVRFSIKFYVVERAGDASDAWRPRAGSSPGCRPTRGPGSMSRLDEVLRPEESRLQVSPDDHDGPG